MTTSNVNMSKIHHMSITCPSHVHDMSTTLSQGVDVSTDSNPRFRLLWCVAKLEACETSEAALVFSEGHTWMSCPLVSSSPPRSLFYLKHWLWKPGVVPLVFDIWISLVKRLIFYLPNGGRKVREPPIKTFNGWIRCSRCSFLTSTGELHTAAADECSNLSRCT